MASTLNVSLPDELRAFLDRQTQGDGSYSTPSEYVRDLIRRERERIEVEQIRHSFLQGYRDLAEGRYEEWNVDALIEEFEEEYAQSQKKKKS